jgi:hypothetical protein
MGRFEKELAEHQETREALDEMIKASRELYGDYAYPAGYLQALTAELIALLPKAKRADYRSQLRRQAQDHKNQVLIKTIKETA